MMAPPMHDDARDVLDHATVDNSNGWWTGVVFDQFHETGERRLRLERWKENRDGLERPHTWRVRPDFWDEERKVATRFQKVGGTSPPGNLPIDSFLRPQEYLRVRKDEVRWIAIVRVSKSWGRDSIRLYHWNADDGTTEQKFTLGRNWNALGRKATRYLENYLTVTA